MARRWCKIPKTFLCEAPDFDKGQDCWPLCDSVFIPICNKRYISKPKNKEIGSVSGKTDSPMSFLSCSLFLWLNPHLDSASFSPLLYLLLHYPFLISLYICNQICIFPKTPTPSPPSNSLDPPGLDPGTVAIHVNLIYVTLRYKSKYVYIYAYYWRITLTQNSKNAYG